MNNSFIQLAWHEDRGILVLQNFGCQENVEFFHIPSVFNK